MRLPARMPQQLPINFPPTSNGSRHPQIIQRVEFVNRLAYTQRLPEYTAIDLRVTLARFSLLLHAFTSFAEISASRRTAATSSSLVRWFTMQARGQDFEFTVAFDR